MKELIIFFLFHYGVMTILYKYNIGLFIVNLANKLRFKFLYNLGICEFCINHHFGIISFVLLYFFCKFTEVVFNGFDYIYLIYPFMSASLINIVKK